MSPAPARVARVGPEKFPHAWGYGAGAFLILTGLIVGVVMIATAVNGLVEDVRDFRRDLGTGSLEATLQSGAEVLVYDENGKFDAGPFDVRVVRVSDELEVATRPVFDGPSYDVDGREGTARAEFKVPSSDIYRIELDTSLGEVAGFAIGGDVGSNRTTGIVRGVIVGSVLSVAGLIAIIITSVVHARWRLRGAVLDRVSAAREAVSQTADDVGSVEAIDGAAGRATSWAQDRVDQARSRLDSQVGSGDPSSWRESLAAQARGRLDQIDQALSSADPALGEAAATAEVPGELAARIDDALGRVQDRIAAGDSLRDIASDERVVAADTARELAEQTRAAGTTAAERFQATEEALIEQAGAGLTGLRDDLGDIAGTALDDVVTQAGDAGDELALGVATTAGAATLAATESATSRVREATGLEAARAGSTAVPPPPAPLSASPAARSSLPPPPGAAPEAPAPSPPPPAVVGPYPAQPVERRDEPEPFEDPVPKPVPDVVSGEQGALRRPHPMAAELETTPMATPSSSDAAPPLAPSNAPEPAAAGVPRLDRPVLAPPPAAMRLAARPSPSEPASPSPAPTGAPAEAVDAFAALAPPPRTILSPPPPVSRPLAAPGTGTGRSPAQGGLAGDADQVAGPAEPDESPMPAAESEKGFRLAPPPDYSGLSR